MAKPGPGPRQGSFQHPNAVLNKRTEKEKKKKIGSAKRDWLWGVKKRKYFTTWKPGQHLIYVSRRKEICFDMWGLRVGAESTQRDPVKHVEIWSRKMGGRGGEEIKY